MKIQKDDRFLTSFGEYEDYYVDGAYVALATFDLVEVVKQSPLTRNEHTTLHKVADYLEEQGLLKKEVGSFLHLGIYGKLAPEMFRPNETKN